MRSFRRQIIVVGNSPIKQRILEDFNTNLYVNKYDNNNVLYIVLHNAVELPYTNTWLNKIAKYHSNQAIGLISIDHERINTKTMLNDRVMSMLYNDFLPLRYGYYPIKFDIQSIDQSDLNKAYQVIHASIEEH